MSVSKGWVLGYQISGNALISHQHRSLAPLDQGDQSARLGDLRGLVNEDGVEVDVPQHPEPRACTGSEHDASFLHSLHGLLDEPRIVRDAPAEARVDRELLQVLVDLGAFGCGSDDLVLVEERVRGVVCHESLEHVVHGY